MTLSKIRDELAELKALVNQSLTQIAASAANQSKSNSSSASGSRESQSAESAEPLKAYGKYCDLLATDPTAAGAYYAKNADAICEGQGMVRAANRKKH